MTTYRKLVAAAAVATSILALSSCGSDDKSNDVAAGCTPAHTFSTIKKGTLTVAAFGNPPFAKVEGGSASGVDPEMLAEIAKTECLKVDYQLVDSAAVIPAVQSGRVDIAIGNWYRTKKRSEVVGMTDPTYLDQMALVASSPVSDIQSLKGKNVGTVDGYLWVADLKALLGDKLKVYPSPVNMFQDLKAGRIEVGVDGFGSASFSAKGMSTSVASPDPAVAASQNAAQSTFPVTKDNTALQEALNAGIAKLKSDGRLAEILKKNGLDGSAADTGEPRLS
ncbi:MAG TPA: ABC transporter substrate-binding protein [Actinokineospora sp.]|nr:ABC transporter substrate-binding protein [Actinokineospora sp.]